MMPETWHFPVDWREEFIGHDGHTWVYRRGLAWEMCVPADATVTVEVIDE